MSMRAIIEEEQQVLRTERSTLFCFAGSMVVEVRKVRDDEL